MIEIDEMKLVERFNNGDLEAFNQLYERYQTVIKKISRRYFGPSIEQEDLWQEASVGLYLAVKKYNPSKGYLSHYIRLHIHSRLKNQVKAAKRKKHQVLNNAVSYNNFVEPGETMTYEDIISSDVSTPEESLLMNEATCERYMTYRTFVSKCSEQERIVLRYYLHGWRNKQISHSTGFSEKSVDNSLTRIKEKIKKFNDLELKVV